MAATASSHTTVPELAFAVRDAARVEHAAVPALAFAIAVEAAGGAAIRSVLLDVQVQIAARRRAYSPATHERLFEVFGPVEGWGATLRTLLWTRATLVVPAFDGATTAQLTVPCSYDLDVLASRYLDALDGGEVPLEFLFSGTVFYAGPAGQLQAGRISWEQEAEYRLPVAVWREALDRHFRGTAWLRLGKERFDRLAAFKARHAYATWDDAIDALLRPPEEDGP
ncbi:MAG TPA: DUF6084 family protein [Solirubrobacteraceae bacterium]|nr:DUF6084 family protein [Solirubrobacteraceae bacterium]